MLEDVYDIEIAKNAKEAFTILNSKKIDLILLDIEMPDISGLDFIVLLKNNERFEDIPVIFISAYSNSYFKDLCRKKGSIGFITKPVRVDFLLNEISNVFYPKITVPLNNPIIVSKLDMMITGCRNKDYMSIISAVNELRKLNYDKETDEKISELCSVAMSFDFPKTVSIALKIKREAINETNRS
jgi:CheY-like chemotaxis protein